MIALNGAGGATQLEVIVNGLTLQGGGHVVLSDDDGNLIFGGAAKAILTNVDNAISGAGRIGGDVTPGQRDTIGNGSGHALVIDTGQNVVLNETLTANGTGGLVILGTSRTRHGVGEQSAATIVGAVTGTGVTIIDGDATLRVRIGSPADQHGPGGWHAEAGGQ